MKKSSVSVLGVGAIGSVISSQLVENLNLELCHFNRSKEDFLK